MMIGVIPVVVRTGFQDVEAHLSNEMRLRAPREKVAENAMIVNHCR